jgi:hypothetical protein
MNLPPPREVPRALLREKEVYRLWIIVHRDFPKTERFGLGQKIEQSFLDVLEYTFASIYLITEKKILMLSKTIAKLDNLKFFLQLAWESRLIKTEKYVEISSGLEEIGRMLGAWRKGLQAKEQKLPLEKQE